MAGGQSGQGVSVSNQLEFSNQPTLMDVAKYSPSGFYIASGDKSGKVRIWDTVNKEHILKNEFQPISGPIKDLAWSSDNQRSVTQFLSVSSS